MEKKYLFELLLKSIACFKTQNIDQLQEVAKNIFAKNLENNNVTFGTFLYNKQYLACITNTDLNDAKMSQIFYITSEKSLNLGDREVDLIQLSPIKNKISKDLVVPQYCLNLHTHVSNLNLNLAELASSDNNVFELTLSTEWNIADVQNTKNFYLNAYNSYMTQTIKEALLFKKFKITLLENNQIQEKWIPLEDSEVIEKEIHSFGSGFFYNQYKDVEYCTKIIEENIQNSEEQLDFLYKIGVVNEFSADAFMGKALEKANSIQDFDPNSIPDNPYI